MTLIFPSTGNRNACFLLDAGRWLVVCDMRGDVCILLFLSLQYLRFFRRKVSRTIKNEAELVEVAHSFTHVSVHALHFETLSIHEQLAAVTRADIYIGVHGAALSYLLFQPLGSTLIEILARAFFSLCKRISSTNDDYFCRYIQYT